jgi:large subunit ribosomal protein L4e
MKVNVYDMEGKVVEDITLPEIFSTEYRPDVIRRAVASLQSNRRQSYGADKLAGKRTSAHYHGRRKYRFTMMNREMSRIPRIHGKIGYMAWRARFAPHAVKGRRAHPPKQEKIWSLEINRKESRLATTSALAASANTELVRERGHKINVSTPLVFVNDFENINKTNQVKKLVGKLLPEEFERAKTKKIRAGKGTMRGRRYRKKKSALIILSGNCNALRASRNIPGFDITTAKDINAELLAPGGTAGRLLITTKAGLEQLEKRFKK